MQLNIKPKAPPPPIRRSRTVEETPSPPHSSNSDISSDIQSLPGTGLYVDHPRAYSCESIYMQYHETTDSESGSVRARKETEGQNSTLSSEFEYYRPTRGSLTTMDKLSDTDFEWTQVQDRANKSIIMPIAHTMEFDPHVSNTPQFYANSVGPNDGKSSSNETTESAPPLRHANSYDMGSCLVYKHPISATERTAPAGSSTHEETEQYPYHAAVGDGYSASTSTTDHSQRFLLGSSSSQSESTIPKDQNLHTGFSNESRNNARDRDYPQEGELGLDSLKTSKAEQIDQMYQDRNDDDGAENRCLWVTCKLFTWTLLVLIAAATLLTAKLSMIFISQALIITTPVSDIIPYNHTLNSTQHYAEIVIIQKYDASDKCHREHRDLLSARVMGNPNVLDSAVLLFEKKVFLDATAFVMIMVILILPSVIGFLAAIYGFFRWEGIRRARLSWRSIVVTFLVSILEALGVSLFAIQVLPYLQAGWALLIPMFIMILPSACHLVGRSRNTSLCRKIVPWIIFLVSNLLASAAVYMVNADLIYGKNHDRQLFWTFPVSVVLIAVSWIPPVFNIQVTGSYEENEIDRLHGKETPETIEDVKMSSLRGRHKVLATFCRLFSYPLAIFIVISAVESYDTWLDIQNLIVPVLHHKMTHHYVFIYFLLNILSSFFSPVAIWGVFAAAIELKISIRSKISRPVSGSFFVLILTFLVTVILALNDMPCWAVLPKECCYKDHTVQSLLIVLVAVLLLLGNLPVIYNVMIANHVILMPFDKVYTTCLFNAVLPDPWVWLNIRPSSLHQRARIPDFRALRQKSKIYICTTMYREDEEEMSELLKSLKRINDSRTPVKPMYEAHVFFDGAYKIINARPRFNGFSLQLVALVEKTFDTKLDMFAQKATPYGLQWEVPLWCEYTTKPMMLYIHLKDNDIVKKKKRWSQIMYMAWALEHDAEVPVEDRYVLITDGDTKFFEKGPVALLDSLLISPEAAAAVGRVRPIITFNPLVWYQAFEYAASFWIYKASNDQLGTDLCCSGCFTMYRGSMLKKVIKDYAAECNNAEDFLMIDMGEDLWLSTLMIRSGWKLKYSSVADVYTRAPSRLEEYYKQRRRWYLSSLAYFFFFIREMKRFKFANAHVTLPFLLYQGLLLFFPLISTSTLGVILAIAVGNSFQIPFMYSAIMIGASLVGQMLFCMFLPSRWQVKGSAVLAIVPSLCTIGVVVIVSINVVKDYMEAFETLNGTTQASIRLQVTGELPLPLPTILISLLMALILLTALLHPKEFYYLFYIIPFIIGSTLGFTFLRPYMLCNVTDQSWGTRETKMPTEESSQEPSLKGKLQECCSSFMCCCRKKTEPDVIPDSIVDPDNSTSGIESSQIYSSEQLSSIHTNYSTLDYSASQQNDVDDIISIPESTNSVYDEMEDMGLTEEIKERMIEIKSELMLRTQAYKLPVDKEDRFWERLIELKLSNNSQGQDKKRKFDELMQAGLRSFQKNMLAVYITLNILWIVILAIFWHLWGSDIRMARWGRHVDVVLLIAIPYTVVNVLQFIAMFIHRMGIWLYLLARTKCHIGSFISCGYPTRSKHTHYAVTISNITRNLNIYQEQQQLQRQLELQEEIERSPIRIPRAVASPKPHRFSDKLDTESQTLDTGISSLAKETISDIYRRDRDPAIHRSSSQPSSGSSFSVVPAIRESSKFVNSRWLLGHGNQGQLTRGETAKGLVLSASQESMVRSLANKKGNDPTALWSHTNTYLPHSTSHMHLANKDQSSSNTENHRDLHQGAIGSPGLYRPRSTPVGPILNSPVIRRLRGQAPPVPPPPRTMSEQVRLDVRDNPAQYMHNLARRRLEVSNGPPTAHN